MQIIIIFAGCNRLVLEAKAIELSGPEPYIGVVLPTRRQSYKKLLNFETFFRKISFVGIALRNAPKHLLMPFGGGCKGLSYAP